MLWLLYLIVIIAIMKILLSSRCNLKRQNIEIIYLKLNSYEIVLYLKKLITGAHDDTRLIRLSPDPSSSSPARCLSRSGPRGRGPLRLQRCWQNWFQERIEWNLKSPLVFRTISEQDRYGFHPDWSQQINLLKIIFLPQLRTDLVLYFGSRYALFLSYPDD